MMSHVSVSEEQVNQNVSWLSSVRPAYFNGQIVAVKDINKPFLTLTKTIILEVNQVSKHNLSSLSTIL